jgi:cytochrome P450
VITRWKDVFKLDLNPAVTAQEDNTLVHQAIKLSIRRLDGEALLRVRAAGMEVLRAKTFTSSWLPRFAAVAGQLIDTLRPRGHADLVTEFAAPFAARTTKLLIGIEDVDDQDLQGAVRAITDAIGNYQDDPQIWARCERANALIDDTVSRSTKHAPPGTILRAMADAGLKPDETRANVKVFAVGLLNEPRHAIPAAIWAVLRDPVQAGLVRADPVLLSPAAEESLRWLPPDRDDRAAGAAGHRDRRRAADGGHAVVGAPGLG